MKLSQGVCRVLKGSVLMIACASCAEETEMLSPFAGTVDEVRACEGSSGVVEGIDVSEYQPTVNWSRVRASGRRFAFIRVSDGLRYVDGSFDSHWSGARGAGLLRGAYQFFRASQDPVAQADLLVRKVGRLGAGDLPPVVDVESNDGVSSATLVANLRRWIERVREGTGREPIVYTAVGFWDALAANTSEFARQKLWVANYGVRCPYLPRDWSTWTFWQYSDRGNVDGISGNVDLNVFNGTIEQLQALAQSSSAPTPSPSPSTAPEPDASSVFCPAGFSYDRALRLCANSDEAVGPFTTAMIARCIEGGGGAATCHGNRWSVAFARSIRGTEVCPPGSAYDASVRHCREGENVFGPFSAAEVEQCRARGGGAVCEGYRWNRAMVPAANAVFCPAGFAHDTDFNLCASATDAVGPFTEAMIRRCIDAGGSDAACRSLRWNVGFARSIRGRDDCPPGARRDASAGGHCVEGDNVFGPFTFAEVDRCKARRGGAVCEGYRWHRSFVTSEPATMTSGGSVLEVPYFYQYNNRNEPGATCGVTSAAMLLNFWGKSTTPDQLYVTYGKSAGQSPSSLASLYERFGLRSAFTYNGTEAMIRRQLDAGRPVITHGYFTSAGHVLVIVGYDRTGWIVNDPAGRWRGCVRCGYSGTSTSTNGRRAHYDYESFRAAAGPDGSYWLSVASRSPVSL
jgi:GH25 family lysozyme M1 (1,4-beta-N-acetylmuramidase)